ncbi:Aldolase-type TIM barrel [Penicillium atrosanguineum]|uniref:Aldolase-type TIM barrel n=1 Tax=Penicillium atrosanguineum TaxID=1132637 RepID=A0A9W9PNG0_9EURO|nr:Aldolase-type TIM barrel [Penicillium atrosanguineum]
MPSTESQQNRLKEWFPHTSKPFIANAPMLGFADYRLATAVTKAGGLGFIGGAFDFSPSSTQLAKLDSELIKARTELGITDSGTLPIGVGFITFTPSGFEENVVPLLEKHRVSAVWLSFPKEDADHGPLIHAIRDARVKSEWSVKVFVQAGTVQGAATAAEQGADVIVVQGTDAGGHQWARGASLLSLLPDVRGSLGDVYDVALLAAGGIVGGEGVCCCVGSRRGWDCYGDEAPASIKDSIVKAQDGAFSTVKSVRHDVFQSTDVFPRQYDGRALVGISWNDAQSGVSDEEVIRRYDEAIKQGDDHRRTVWAGASVGSISSVLSVSDLMEQIQQEVKLTTASIMGCI